MNKNGKYGRLVASKHVYLFRSSINYMDGECDVKKVKGPAANFTTQGVFPVGDVD